MSLKSKLKVESIGMLTASAFYAIVGIISFVVLATVDFRLVHIGIIGILNLITAYGLFKKRGWTIWVIVVLFFVATTFSGYTLFLFFGKYLLLDIGAAVYLILTWVFTAYAADKRKILTN